MLERLVEHPPALVRAPLHVHLVDESLGHRVGVVVAVGELAHEIIVRLRIEPPQRLPSAAGELDPAVPTRSQ